MTPETNIALCAQPSTSTHLTEIQFGELLASTHAAGPGCSPTEAEAEEHLLACEQCAAELAGLRDSLSLFRRASTAYSNDQLRRLPPMPLPARPILSPALQPAYLVAAAALVLAAFLPMQGLRQHAPQAVAPANASASAGSIIPAHPTESNEALLDDIDHEVSASVPAPMQALADPAADTDISAQTSTQRKD